MMMTTRPVQLSTPSSLQLLLSLAAQGINIIDIINIANGINIINIETIVNYMDILITPLIMYFPHQASQ